MGRARLVRHRIILGAGGTLLAIMLLACGTGPTGEDHRRAKAIAADPLFHWVPAGVHLGPLYVNAASRLEGGASDANREGPVTGSPRDLIRAVVARAVATG